tara:strand:- start:1418 stop:2512 length:1095 start_codon:yes stop_codon:yes gene_type:complete
MRLGIIGIRGVPNYHGGFEQFAEYFSVYMANNGCEVYVYNSHKHPYQEKLFKGVNIIHCYDPEHRIGTSGQFIYDLNCILDSRKRNFDVILQLGYTSSSIWSRLFPKKSVIVTNMDGLEWKRSKYTPAVQNFLKYAEKLAIKHSDFFISDSKGIYEYIKDKYKKESQYIAYGADVFLEPDETVLSKFSLEPNKYSVLIARLEPENNIETIITGYTNSKREDPLIIFGTINKFGEILKKKFKQDNRVQFLGANYNINELNNLRFYSRYYFHGHSVGGTNPSLLEAMASSALIIAHNNIFNASILASEARYFDNSEDISNLLNLDEFFLKKEENCSKNRRKIEEKYNWEKINQTYNEYLMSIIKNE